MKRFVVWARATPDVETVVEAESMDAARQTLADALGLALVQAEARVFIQGDERLLQE
jgi:hypothetical protein